ncbi:MAG TPA: cob(I)yrinic acid a,c-diamide adenosyltransferase [Salinivirgaceae bacterium]|nr:cob(I)yrinic acid a,c-diamide adenosyltransferase [Salinivirgaceae bacterium]
MKIYTKTGDDGTTSLLGGTRVPKYHLRIEAYGTVDELISYLGLLRDQPKMEKHWQETIIEIQERLMSASAILAAEDNNEHNPIPPLYISDVEFLEREMDVMNDQLPPLRSFILPGGNVTVSHTHVARCICRRAERLAIQVQENYGNCEMVVKYLNRLSDFLFVLARKLSFDLKAKEIVWQPRI